MSHRLNNCSSFKLLILKLGFKTGRTVRRTTFTVQNKDTAKSSQHENWWVIEVKSRFKVKIFRRTRTNKRERTGPFAWSTHATISDDCFPWKKALMQTPEALSCQITSPINKKIFSLDTTDDPWQTFSIFWLIQMSHICRAPASYLDRNRCSFLPSRSSETGSKRIRSLDSFILFNLSLPRFLFSEIKVFESTLTMVSARFFFQ